MASNNVDNKVVKMEFDNAQFEAGVQQTLSSLEDLKESLKFNNSLSGINAISNAISSFSLANIADQISTLTSRFSNLGIVGMTAIENITNKAMNLATGKIGGIISQMKTGGWARASSIAQSRFTLEGLFEGDAEKVETAFNSASEAVDGTAYSLNEAVSAASQLAASGVDVGEEMQGVLKGIAGTAAMTGNSFDSVAHIFTTVAGNGRLMGMQLTQLSSYGLNAAATLGDYLGKTEAEVRDMVSKGEISFDTFSAAMQEAFGEHAKDANKTFSGSVDNIKSAINRIGAIFASGIIENDDLINTLNDIRLAINKVKTAISPLEDKFKNLVSAFSKLTSYVINGFDTTALEYFIDIVGRGMDAISGIINHWVKLKEAAKESIFGDQAEKVEATAEQIERATEIVAKANEIWEQGLWGVGEARKEALGDDYDLVQKIVNKRASGITDLDQIALDSVMEVDNALKETNNTLGQTGEQADETAGKIAPIGRTIKAFGSFLEGIKTIVNGLRVVVNKTITSFKKVFKWDDLINDIKDYGTIFSGFMSNFEMTSERSEKLEKGLTGLFSAFDLIRQIVKTLAAGLAKVLGPVLSIIFDLILTLSAKIGDAITKFDEWYKKNDILRGALETLGTVVSKVIEYVGTFFEKLSNLPAVQQIREELDKLGELVGTTLVSYFGDASEKVTNFFGGLDPEDDNGMTKVLETINGLLEDLIDFCGDAQDATGDFFGWISEKIGSLLGFNTGLTDTEDKLTKLTKAGEKIAQSNSMGEFLTNITDTMSQFGLGVDKAVDWIIEKFNSLDAAKLAVISLGGSLTAFGISMSYLSYNVAEFVKSFTSFPKEITNTIRAFKGVFAGMSEYLRNDSKAKVLKAYAIAFATLAASLFILTKYTDEDDLIKTGIVLGTLILIMAATVKIMSSTAAKMGDTKDFYKTLSSMSLLFVAIAASAFILTAALKELSSLKWGLSMIAPCVALIAILGTLVGVAFLVSKMEGEFKTAAIGILAFAAGVWLVAKAMVVLNQVELDGLWDKVWMLIGIVATLAVFSVAASKLKFTSAMGLLAVIGSIWLIELALKYIIEQGVSMKDIMKHLDQFTPVLLALLTLAIFIGIVGAACKGANNVALTIVATAAAIYIVVKAMQVLADVPLMELLKALVVVYVLFEEIRRLVKSLATATVASNAGKNILKISIAIAILAVVVGLIGHLDVATLTKGLVVVTILTVLVGALIYVSQFSKDINYKALYAIVVAIGVMALVVALLSYIKDLESVYAAAGIMSLMLLSLGMSLYLAGKYAKRLQTSHLVIMVTAIVLIAGSLFLLSQYGDIGKMITAAVSICGVLLVIASSLAIIKKALGNTDFGKNSRIAMMILVISMLAAIAAALYFLGKNDPQSTAVAALAIIAVFGTVTLALGQLVDTVKKSKFDNSVLLLMAAMAAMIGVIAASLYIVIQATKDVPYENVLASLIAMATLMIVVAGIATYIKDMKTSFNLGALGVVASALLVLVTVSYALREVLESGANWEQMVSAAASMGIVMLAVAAVIAVLMAVTEGTGIAPAIVVLAGLSAVLLSLAAACIAFAKTADAVVSALERFAKIDFGAIDTTAILELVKAILEIVLICYLAGPALVILGVGVGALALSLAGLAAALLLLVAPVSVMVGLFVIFTRTFQLLTTVFGESRDVIVDGLTSIGIGLANSILYFVQTITSNSTTIVNCINAMLLAILNGIIDFGNKATIAIAEGILKFLDIIDEYGPQIITKATNTLLNLLSTLAQNAYKFAILGALIVSEFVVGFLTGLSQKLGPILDAAFQFAISFIYGIADTIYNNYDSLLDAVKYLGLVLIRELIATFNIAGVFDDSLAEIDGEIEYQKSLREQEGEEAKEAFNDGVNSVDTAEIGEVDTTNATNSLKSDGETAGNAWGTSFIDGAKAGYDKLTNGELLNEDTLTSNLSLDGTSIGNMFGSSISQGTVETMDVSHLPDTVKADLEDQGWVLNESGTEMSRQVESGMNDYDLDLDSFNTEITDSIGGDPEELTAQGNEDLDYYIDGLTDVTEERIRKLRETGARLGNEIHVGATSEDGLDENSPSEKAREAGRYYVQGLILGAEDLSGSLSTSYAKLANNACEEAAGMMSTISKIVQDDSIDWTPTIVPVIDDSQLQNGSNLLTNTFGNSALNMAANTALSVNDASANTLASQVATLSEQVEKLANTDYSKMFDGVAVNVNTSTNVDGKQLKTLSSDYTIEKINTKQRLYNMSRGARA